MQIERMNHVEIAGPLTANSEIAELIWIDTAHPGNTNLAPLTRSRPADRPVKTESDLSQSQPLSRLLR
jgi:hypothetical protein